MLEVDEVVHEVAEVGLVDAELRLDCRRGQADLAADHAGARCHPVGGEALLHGVPVVTTHVGAEGVGPDALFAALTDSPDSLAEAMALRAAGIAAPVLSWLNPPTADFVAAVAAGVELAVPGLEHLHAQAGIGERQGSGKVRRGLGATRSPRSRISERRGRSAAATSRPVRRVRRPAG